MGFELTRSSNHPKALIDVQYMYIKFHSMRQFNLIEWILFPFNTWINSNAYGTYWPSFQSPILENIGVVLYNKWYQIIELFILLQLIQVLTPGSN